MTTAFIDESGNTGQNMFDPAQPMYFTAAMVTDGDFDNEWGDRVKAYADSVGHELLHGSVLSPSQVEQVSPSILSLIQEANARFVVTGVHKETHVAMKIFDYIFDPGENHGAAWHHYWLKPLRVTNALLFMQLLTLEDRKDGWRSLMDSNKGRSTKRFQGMLNRILPRVDEIADPRQREVFKDAIGYAAKNRECIYVHGSSKALRFNHLPNLALFPELLAGIDSHSVAIGQKTGCIRHDQCSQFDKYLKAMHKMVSEVKPYEMKLPFGVNLNPSRVPNSIFEIHPSNQSAGIQVIDHILWVISRAQNGFDVPRGCTELLEFVDQEASKWFITTDSMLRYLQEEFENLATVPFTSEDEQRAKELIQIDKDRRKGMM